MFFDDCLKNSFVGVDYGMDEDFSNELVENWKDFNKNMAIAVEYNLEY